MAADHPAHQAFVSQVVEAAALAVALARGIHKGQALWCVLGLEALLQGNGDFLGEADANEAAAGQVGVIRNSRHRLGGAHHFAHGLPRAD